MGVRLLSTFVLSVFPFCAQPVLVQNYLYYRTWIDTRIYYQTTSTVEIPLILPVCYLRTPRKTFLCTFNSVLACEMTRCG